MRRRVDLVVAGVGGQGVLALSRVIGVAALMEGYDVKIAEVHGMAQRGGSLVTHVRIGGAVLSPLIPRFSADVLVSLEALEAARHLALLRPGGLLATDDYVLPPTGLSSRAPDVLSAIRGLGRYRVEVVRAREVALRLGEVRAANMVMLGFLVSCSAIPISKSSAIEALRSELPARYLEVNLRAFNAGYELGRRKGFIKPQGTS